MAYMLLRYKKPLILRCAMWIIKDFIRTVREGAANGDRPVLAAMFCLFVLSLALIAYGLAK
ncbi:hypothetical protein GHYDROH2_10120 [Geobacter hydrogenophilus]|uniref:Uncharacterized protein n=1 Tax=Geobacter hydrogenophilus TaxID=40983 RepID=A0A9W6FZ31_9BACT|nr:hypothetical protein [Geobacter hydrogenophilus]GLI37511.1 hypothetical protein GHYDROH2_10120 [Geobacter hydrogenophilus]